MKFSGNIKPFGHGYGLIILPRFINHPPREINFQVELNSVLTVLRLIVKDDRILVTLYSILHMEVDIRTAQCACNFMLECEYHI